MDLCGPCIVKVDLSGPFIVKVDLLVQNSGLFISQGGSFEPTELSLATGLAFVVLLSVNCMPYRTKFGERKILQIGEFYKITKLYLPNILQFNYNY